jgi:L-serine dehydratase
MSQEGRCSTIGVRERNAVGAVKAIAAASLALHGDGLHRVSLDGVVVTMRRPAPTCSRSTRRRALGGWR